MKKSLLFIMPSLAAGGGEKSLINLLTQIDYSQYQVDLFLLNHEGIFMEFLPKEVRVLAIPEMHKLFALPLGNSIAQLVLGNKLSLVYNRIMFAFKNANHNGTSINEQRGWKDVAKSLERLVGQYDVAIGFLEKTATYICVDKVTAATKIGWVHIDYDKLGMDPDFDIGYFEQLDHIITVSEECASILKRRFPSQQHKVDVIHNIVSPKTINHMADQGDINIYKREKDEIIILSIGRLHEQKGFEMSIEACKKLVNKGYNIRWYIIGEGAEREKLANLIKANQLEDHFILLGLKSNPYPYIKQADIYAQTSKFEGKSIAIDEAKILNKPIVVTNFSTARDQIVDGFNGLIVEMNSDAVVDGIERIIMDKQLANRLTSSLSVESLGTEEEIHKLYALMGGRL